MRRRAPSGQARHREVEAAPEEVDRADLAEEVAAEFRKDVAGRDEDAPKARDGGGVVRGVLRVFLERDGCGDFGWRRVDRDVDAQLAQCGHPARVEVAAPIAFEK